MRQSAFATYANEITKRLWAFRDDSFANQPSLFDPAYTGPPNPPVFVRNADHLNVLAPEDPAKASAVRSLLPKASRHKWFRSMKSSQALAVSVFGNLKVLNRVECLSEVMADDSAGPAFGSGPIDAARVELEHDVRSLNEVRSTSIDVLVSGPTIVCVECKLTEAEVGRCSRPALPKDHREHCDGAYRQQAGRSRRCALAERAIAYWDNVPYVLAGVEWQADRDHDPCPLAEPYQLVRNVLAACVTEDGKVNTARGHALLVYDARNPAFQPHPAGVFERLRGQLVEPPMLRRCSWQTILRTLADYEDLKWLVRALDEKYGLAPI